MDEFRNLSKVSRQIVFFCILVAGNKILYAFYDSGEYLEILQFE